MRGRSDGLTPPLCCRISDFPCSTSSLSLPKPKRQANFAHSASSDGAGPRLPQNAASASSTAALTCRRRSAPLTCASARANKHVLLAPGLPSFPFPFSFRGLRGKVSFSLPFSSTRLLTTQSLLITFPYSFVFHLFVPFRAVFVNPLRHPPQWVCPP